MTTKIIKTPFPSAGEVVQFLLKSLSIGEFIEDESERVKFTKNLERLAKEKDLDIERMDEIIEDLLNYLPEEIKETSLIEIIKALTFNFSSDYKEIVVKLPSTFAERIDILQILMPHFAEFFVLELHSINRSNLSQNIDFPSEAFWYLPFKENDSIVYPMQRVLNWWARLCGFDNLKQFAKKVGQDISDEGYSELLYQNIYRWKTGIIPSWESLKDLIKPDYSLPNQQHLKKSFLVSALIARAIQIAFNNAFNCWGNDIFKTSKNYFKDGGQAKYGKTRIKKKV